MTASQSGKTSVGGAASRGCGEFREKSANCILHCGGELERGALFQEGRHRAYVVSHVRQELVVITKTAK